MENSKDLMDHSAVQEVQKIADSVEGWLGKREGPYLYQLAKVGSRLGAIVEIGSWQGRSTIWLGRGSETVNGYEIYAIDPHVGGPRRQHNVSTEKAFRENIQRAGLAKKVVPIVALSSDALKGWSRPIGMLWIDGDHRYEAVSGDFLGGADSSQKMALSRFTIPIRGRG
jgi:predicted O-methyltransferase YrrM